MAANSILQFSDDGAALVLSQAAYLADSQRRIGNQPGIARADLMNKAMRQSSLVAAAVAQFIATRQLTDVVDTLTPAQIELMLSTALSGNGTAILNVSSTANALVANFTPAATTRLLGVQIAKALATNTTTTPTLARDAQAALPIVKGNNLPLVAGDILSGSLIAFCYDAALNKEVLINPATGVVVNTSVVLRSYLAGLTLSSTGPSTTMTTAAGQATDSTNATTMTLIAATAKTTAAWVVGTAVGGLDTGTIANNTWYHFYAMLRPDTGVVDVSFSLSANAPTTGGSIPAAYTRFRRIGSGLTNGSGQWVPFQQRGDKVLWNTAVMDIDSLAFVGTSTFYTISTPLGVKTEAILRLFKSQGTTGTVNFWTPDIGVVGASTSTTPLGVGHTDSATGASISEFLVLTNTSRQIYGGASAGSQSVKLLTNGWIDTRGRDL